ncbi:MAG: cytochrome c biogenesis protein ResB [Candidatus Methylacidiphilales bacterium]
MKTFSWWITRLVDILSSLKLTVACLSVSMVLVFVSTLAQVELGIYEAQARYFETWWVWAELGDGGIQVPWLPGGYWIGLLLIANLVTAHWKRFRLQWNKAGLWMVHLGILILLVGGFVTHWMAHEGQLRFDEGEKKHYYESFLERELVVTERLAEAQVREVRFDTSMIRKENQVSHPDLPFTLNLTHYLGNSRLTLKPVMASPSPSAGEVNRGWGQLIRAEEVPPTYKPDEQNLISVRLTPVWNDQALGTWLVTNAVGDIQWFRVEDRQFGLSLRRKRFDLPYAMTLIQFTHDRYPGTNIPKNFSSRVLLEHPEFNEERETLIYMNQPLRYRGKTFYQAGFDNNDTTSILQVVENPGWLLPYVSCLLVSLGLTWHFLMHLSRHLNRRREAL